MSRATSSRNTTVSSPMSIEPDPSTTHPAQEFFSAVNNRHHQLLNSVDTVKRQLANLSNEQYSQLLLNDEDDIKNSNVEPATVRKFKQWFVMLPFLRFFVLLYLCLYWKN